MAGRGLGKQASVIDAALGGEGGHKSRLRAVEFLMPQTKQEKKARTQELNKSRKRMDEFKGISEAAEKRMMENSKTLGEFKDQLEAKVNNRLIGSRLSGARRLTWEPWIPAKDIPLLPGWQFSIGHRREQRRMSWRRKSSWGC